MIRAIPFRRSSKIDIYINIGITNIRPFRRIVSRNRGNFRGNSNGDSIKEKIREQLKYRDPCEFSSKHSRHVCHGTRRSRNETLEVRVATQSPGSYTWLNVECLVEMMSTADEIIEIGHEIVKLALKLAR